LDIDLSLVRSLTVFGEAGDANFDLHEYQLLRVLGLEECTDLGDDHLRHICNLLLLKYLGLGSAFTSLPKGIEKLKLLETLDLRRTKVEVLPIEVILLPSLIHLFGKFKISDKVKRTSELQNFLLSGQCNLETLAGFVTDQSQGFPQILSHMKKLRKVKIWCERTASSTNLSDLELAIQKFIHDEKEETHESRSLSLHFDEHCSEDILNSLKEPCYLTSLKITSKLLELPQFVKALRDLRELCLSSTKLTAVLLAALTELRSLKYLKLIADHLEEFIIKDQAFPRLLRLCFVLQCPTLPKIEEGALPYLMSLQLICKDLVGLADMKIEHLRCLKEVTLDQKVTPETREAWEKAAKEHPNRPKVLLFKTIDPTESEHTDHSVDSEPEEHEIVEASVDLEEPEQVVDSQMLVNKGSGSYAMTKKRKYSAVQSSSNGEASSSFDDMGTARCLLVPIDPGL
jgi:disease resistance protein RPM1